MLHLLPILAPSWLHGARRKRLTHHGLRDGLRDSWRGGWGSDITDDAGLEKLDDQALASFRGRLEEARSELADAEELREGDGEARVKGQVVKELVDAPRAEEVKDDLVGSLKPSLFDLVEQLSMAFDLLTDGVQASAQLLYLS